MIPGIKTKRCCVLWLQVFAVSHAQEDEIKRLMTILAEKVCSSTYKMADLLKKVTIVVILITSAYLLKSSKELILIVNLTNL